MSTTEYPQLPSEPAEAWARELGYPSNDVVMCGNCDGTGMEWWHYDRNSLTRCACGKCNRLGWVPRVYPYAFLGTATTYAEAVAHGDPFNVRIARME